MRNFLAVLFFFGILTTFSAAAFAQKRQFLDEKFKVTTLDGKTYAAQDLRGKIVVFNLWFFNCPICVEEIKLINKLADEYQNDKDVVFLGLANNNPSDLQKFLKKNPFKYQIVPNAKLLILTQFAEPDKNGQINVAFPAHIVLNRQGEKVANVTGIKGVEAVRNELQKQTASKNANGKKTN